MSFLLPQVAPGVAYLASEPAGSTPGCGSPRALGQGVQGPREGAGLCCCKALASKQTRGA